MGINFIGFFFSCVFVGIQCLGLTLSSRKCFALRIEIDDERMEVQELMRIL